MKSAPAFLVLLLLAMVPNAIWGQLKEVGEQNVRPVPEMEKLFNSFAGDWDTSELRERTQLFPDGGERKGKAHIRLASGGSTLVMEGHSDGSAGRLSYIIVIWWDQDTSVYRYFTCFKDTGSSCEIRGTAHWDHDKFVNDYEEPIHGKKMQFRDTFQEITPNSYTLVFAWVKEDGTIENQIVSRAIRHAGAADRSSRKP